MARLTVVALACAGAMFLAGCASTPSMPVAEKAGAGSRVLVRNGSTSSASHGAARYSLTDRACSVESLQLLSADEVDALTEGWREPDDCEGPEKLSLPAYGASPGRKGSAHVLVRLTAEGAVESVQAVCATDRRFGETAVETVKRIRFSHMTCKGVPTRVAFFLPLDYKYD
ncbi:energy transducer TonB [Lysobacter sp. LF1]|uniref:Energy transducer TonB n=1 Tax=Lysobacter stagni TaxID=3045172 RepID=A0ABT6XF62_9GAMM|nr:energy transducer TonB [Lysobacter sp. LF1]MDI9238791.1 energy transducer TonB [Lysobacter sp. LF1]